MNTKRALSTVNVFGPMQRLSEADAESEKLWPMRHWLRCLHTFGLSARPLPIPVPITVPSKRAPPALSHSAKKVLPRFLNSRTKEALTGNPNTPDGRSAAAGRGLAADAPSVRARPLEDAPRDRARSPGQSPCERSRACSAADSQLLPTSEAAVGHDAAAAWPASALSLLKAY